MHFGKICEMLNQTYGMNVLQTFFLNEKLVGLQNENFL